MAKNTDTTTAKETPAASQEVADARYKFALLEKMQAGLSRAQAEEILAAQAKHDADLEA